MALDLLAIISAAGTGAVTGYLTNNLALKMIFKEYGPLGGVVIKTKDEFIDNISALVERDLINHQSLESEFSRAEFKASYSAGIKDFINIHLEERTAAARLADLPGWEQNYEFLSSLAAAGGSDLAGKSSSLLESEKLENLLAESELKMLVEKIYRQFLKKAEAKNLIEKLCQNFYEKFEDYSLAELLTEDLKTELSSFLEEAVSLFEAKYQSLNKVNQAEFRAKIKELFNLPALSKSLLAEIRKIKLADLFKKEADLKNLKEEAQVKDLIKELFLNFKIEIDNSNLSLAALLDEKTESELKRGVENFLSLSQKEVLSFVDQEAAELNQIIFKAVEAEIEASSGFKAMSRQGIYSKYKEKTAEYGLPAEHLKDYLQLKLKEDKKQTAAELTAQIKELKLSRILAALKAEADLFEVEDLVWNFYQANKDKKLFQLFSEENFLEQEVEKLLVEFLFNLFKKISADSESVELIFNFGLQLQLSDLVKKESFAALIEKNSKKFYQLLAQNERLSEKITAYLNENFFQLLKSSLNNKDQKVEKGIKSYLNQLKTEAAQKKLTDFYQPLKTKAKIADLTDSSLDFFYNNLPDLLEGRIAEAAAANLYQLSDQEVQTAIEEFMGKELKPITYLGALLGAAAGVIFTLSGAQSAASELPLGFNYLSSILLYGGVGWLTNVLAIRMLFKPYQEKKIAGIKLPFTPGVVAKNRSRFASSMGKFVEKELLKADSAAAVVENNREEIKSEILNYFKEQNYQPLFNLLAENRKELAEIIINKLLQLLADFKLKKPQKLLNLIDQALFELLTEKIEEFDIKAQIKASLSADSASQTAALLLQQAEKSLLEAVSRANISSAAAGKYSFNFSSQQLKKGLKNSEIYPFFKYLLALLPPGSLNYNLQQSLKAELEANSEKYLKEGFKLISEQKEEIARKINFKKDEIIAAEKEKQDGLLKSTLISGALYMADLDQFVEGVVKRTFKELQLKYFEQRKTELEKLYSRLLMQLDEKVLFNSSILSLEKLLANLIKSEKGGDLITKTLYLSEDKISQLIENFLNDSKQQLISAQLEIDEQSIDYFLKKQLSLEAKLKLLLKLKNIFSSDQLKNELLKLLEEAEVGFLKQELKVLTADFKISEAELDFKKVLKELTAELALLFEKEEYKNILEAETAAQLEKVAAELKTNLKPEALDYLLQLFIESGIDSFEATSEEILKSLNLQDLTQAEVEKMNPAEIEAIFENFAGRYFTQLKHYGWFGGVFGLLQLLIRNLI